MPSGSCDPCSMCGHVLSSVLSLGFLGGSLRENARIPEPVTAAGRMNDVRRAPRDGACHARPRSPACMVGGRAESSMSAGVAEACQINVRSAQLFKRPRRGLGRLQSRVSASHRVTSDLTASWPCLTATRIACAYEVANMRRPRLRPGGRKAGTGLRVDTPGAVCNDRTQFGDCRNLPPSGEACVRLIAQSCGSAVRPTGELRAIRPRPDPWRDVASH